MVVWIALLAAGVVTAAPAKVEREPVRLPCPDVAVQAVRRVREPRHGSFSAGQVGDLEFVVTYTKRLVGHRAELKILTPKGHVYQVLAVPLDAARHGRLEASVRLPVSGTLIVNSGLYGRWLAETHLDGSATSCGRAEPFTLEP